VAQFFSAGSSAGSDRLLANVSKNKHISGGGEGQNVDWAQYYWRAQDEPELPITESRPYDFTQHYTYMGGITRER
jgi:hypothetical protein